MSLSAKWRRRWERATSPKPTVTDREQWLHGRLLMSLLLTVLPLGWLASSMPKILGVSSPLPDHHMVVMAIASVVYAAAFKLARDGRTQLATMISVVTGVGIIYITSVMDASLSVLMYLLLPILVASVLLPLRVTIWLAAAILAATPGVLLLIPGATLTRLILQPFTFLVTGIVLLVVVTRHRERVRQEAESSRRESELRYRDLFESTFDGIAIHDEGRIVNANRGLARILETTPEALRGQPIDGWMDEESRAALTRALKDGGTDPLEVSGRRQNGDVLHAEILIRRPSDETSLADGLLAIRDVTDRHQAEETLRVAQRLDSVGLLAGGVAHDYNNILMAIMGNASVAQERHRREQPVGDQLSAILDASDRARTLTDQLLTYAGRSLMRRTPQDLHTILADQRSLLESALPHNVWLEFEPGAEEMWANCDVGQIGQVILNVVLNGAEAMMARGGAITLRVDAITLGNASGFDPLGGLPLEPGPYVVIDVIDRGIGMDERTVERMFEPFFSTKDTGHGLGLAAVAGIVRAHRGGVRITSTRGEGTTVRIALPAAEPGNVVDASESSAEDVPFRDIGVLVVDDDHAVLETVTALLESGGVSVIAVDSGQRAVKAFRERRHEIAAVVLDLKMPVMDGEVTFHALRAIDPTVRVVFASGFSEPGTVKELLNRGEAAFISKPFRRDELISTIESIIPGRISGPRRASFTN